MTKNASTLAAGLFAGIGLLLNGCSALRPKPDATRFYILRAAAPPASTTAAPAQAATTLRVGPGHVAAYLDSTRILTETGPNGVQPLGFHQWAEPLAKGIERTLVSALRNRAIGVDVVGSYESSASNADSRLAYEITRLGGAPGADVVLEATWSIAGTHWVVPKRTSRITVPFAGSTEDVAAYVARLSRAVEEWSREIAAALK